MVNSPQEQALLCFFLLSREPYELQPLIFSTFFCRFNPAHSRVPKSTVVGCIVHGLEWYRFALLSPFGLVDLPCVQILVRMSTCLESEAFILK